MPMKDPEKRRAYFRDLMRRRRAGQRSRPRPLHDADPEAIRVRDAEIARLRAEIARLREAQQQPEPKKPEQAEAKKPEQSEPSQSERVAQIVREIVKEKAAEDAEFAKKKK